MGRGTTLWGITAVAHLLTTQQLGHTFGKSWLFRHLDLELSAGDRLLVLGQNGSGKSTLLKCISGLVRPREGAVNIYGKFGYSSLDLALYPNLSALEHLALLNSESPDYHQSVLDQVGLGNTKSQGAGEFSTGMRARLKLALAILNRPEILLLDEPSAALDESGRQVVDSIIQSFTGAIIIASNDPLERRWATHELEIE